MDCKKCGGNSNVVSTVKYRLSVLRERKCAKCGRRWYTEEYENNEMSQIIHREKRERYVLGKEVKNSC